MADRDELAGLRRLAELETKAAGQSSSGGVASNLLDLGGAFVHHAMNLPHGAAQFAQNVTAGLAQRVAPESKIAEAISGTAWADEQAMAQREREYQARTPNTLGAYAGAVAGEVAPFMFGGAIQQGMRGLGQLGATPFQYLASKFPSIAGTSGLLGKVAGGGLQGGAIGTTIPVTQPGSYAEQKAGQVGTAGAIGGALPLSISTIQGIYQGGKNLLAPVLAPMSVVNDALLKWAGPNVQEIAGKMRGAPELVPGSVPTSAQVAGSPGLVQIEKTLANDPRYKEQFVTRQIENNSARLEAINRVAGEPGALEAAKANRDEVAKNLYGWAFDHTPEVTPWVKGQITQLTRRPAIQEAMKEARTLAKNEGIKFTDATSIQGLHYTKKALDDQIGAAMRAGSNNEARILIETRDKLLTLMDNMSPTYAQARQEFAQLSKPINTMEAGRAIAEKVSSGALDASGKPIVTLPGFRSAYASALKNAEFGINPEAQAMLDGIQADLQRSTISSSIRAAGSDTAFNLQAPGWLGRRIYGKDFEGPMTTGKIIGGLAGGAATGHPILGAAAGYAIAKKIGQFGGGRVNEAMTKVLLDKELFAGLLTAKKAGNTALVNRIQGLLSERGVPAASYSATRQMNPSYGLVNP